MIRSIGGRGRESLPPPVGDSDFRPFVIVHIGAGECSELDGYLALQPQRIVLIEADPDEARKLVRRAADRSEVEVISVGVAEFTEKKKLNVFNLSDWNSLRMPAGLRGLFPGLRLLREIEVETVSPAELMERIGLNPEGNNWVIIDAPGEESTVLKGLRESGYLARFERIVLHCGHSILYEGAEIAGTLLQVLHEDGYDIASLDEGDDPDLPHWVLQRNPHRLENLALRKNMESLQHQLREQTQTSSREIERLRAIVADQARLADDHAAVIERMIAERDALEHKAEDYLRQIVRIESEHSERLQAMEERIEALVSTAENDRAALLDQLVLGEERSVRYLQEFSSGQHDHLDKIVQGIKNQLSSRLTDEQLESYQRSMKELEKQLLANIGKDLGVAVRQIESFVSIHSYLNNGNVLAGFHGWSISPDIGLLLMERIRERRHDLIIEFGSGTSSALFAKALQVVRRDIAADGKVRPVCSFEHDLVYLRKTQTMLESQGLQNWVTVHHAPLIDWRDDTGSYLYYDCDVTLAAIAQQLAGEPKRVLLLVDGPPEATCANARYPAVPKIFKHLARHEIDLVLDDAGRPEEKAIIELWRAYWKRHSIHMVEEATGRSEKGIFWARNYSD